MLYSHDGMGLGHIRRNLTLAGALVAARPDAAVLLATGAEALDAFSIPTRVDVLRLPGVRKIDNAHYAARRLAVSLDDLRELRAALLTTAVERFRPHVVLADKHPGGLQGELVPALERLRSLDGRAVLGLRDVLDEPERARRDWRTTDALEHLREFHERILVYGQREVVDPLAGCGLPTGILRRVRYCGYVVSGCRAALPASSPRPWARRLVVATAGGGEDGTPVLRAFLGGARGAGWDALAVAGPHADPAGYAELERLARDAGAHVVASVRGLGDRLAAAHAVVCMGGYNSLVEVLAARLSAVCVPRVVPRAEQLVRARAFAARGLIRVVEPADLDPATLRAEVDAALATDRRGLAERIGAALDFDGASRASAELIEIARAAQVSRVQAVR
jgi:predicted glycosyltransferase